MQCRLRIYEWSIIIQIGFLEDIWTPDFKPYEIIDMNHLPRNVPVDICFHVHKDISLQDFLFNHAYLSQHEAIQLLSIIEPPPHASAPSGSSQAQ